MKKDVEIKRIQEVMDCESDDGNFIVDFSVLSRKYGAEYIAICQAMWGTNESVMTEDEFIKMNGNMPKGFFEKVIKK